MAALADGLSNLAPLDGAFIVHAAGDNDARNFALLFLIDRFFRSDLCGRQKGVFIRLQMLSR
jgi:hypothetical protein